MKVEKSCQNCGKTFNGRGKNCSHKCAGNILIKKHREILICKNCGKEKLILRYRLEHGKKFCSRKCHYEFRKKIIKNDHPLWKGGRSIHAAGYIVVNLGGKNNHRLEHDLIMEKYLGRKLGKWEIVHHKNENKQDNKIDNLKLMTRKEHTILHKEKLVTADTKI